MGMMQEFKDFAIKGNVVDMAVGLVIGAAFGKIVSTFVASIISPIVGYVAGGADLTKITTTVIPALEDKAGLVLKTGELLQTIFDFTIVAFAIFMVVKLINSAKKKEEAAAPAGPSAQEKLLMEIRDSLKK